MCTSLAWENGVFYFGRNLDLEEDFGQHVVIMPRRHTLHFHRENAMGQHYAMIGMATILEGQALYADAVNEKGLCIAGLNFPEYAFYPDIAPEGKRSIAPFELPWWLLGQCSTVQEAREILRETCIVNMPFSKDIPVSPLHWHLADKKQAMVVECMKDGLHLHEDPVGVLTNSPPYDFHTTYLRQYMNLTSRQAVNRFSDEIDLQPFGRGLGGYGLPGDASPASRFVRAAFLKLNSVCKQDEESSVAHFFHLLDSLAMTSGSVLAPGGKWEHTLYSCCINTDEGVYYYKTYGNNQLTAVHLRNANLEGEALVEFPLETRQHVLHVN